MKSRQIFFRLVTPLVLSIGPLATANAVPTLQVGICQDDPT